MSPLLVAGNIVGYIGAIILWFQAVFGSRHIFKYITSDTVLINRLHKQLGIYGMLLIALHPLLEMMVRLENLLWIITPDFIVPTATYITLGKIAFVLLILVWITSAMIREKIKWKPWKYIHLLAYPLVVLVFIHMKQIGTFMEHYTLIQAIWFSMFLIFILASFARLLAYAGVLKNPAQITELTMVGESIILITFKPQTLVTPSIGQHIYIQTGRFRSEHPFTIMEYHQEEGTLTLGIRKLGGLWNELIAKHVGDTILIDGPYGVFTREAQNTNPKVLIAGGIGVTPFVDLMRTYGENAIYINCNRQLEDAVRRDVLMSHAKSYLDIVDTYSGDTNPSIRVGRISKEIIQEVVGDETPHLPYFICGSPMFITIVKGILIDSGVPKKSIYFEELGF